MSDTTDKICILSGAYDDKYLVTRNDDPILCTSAGKRRILYRAIAEAFGSSPLLLSLHPRGRGVPQALPEMTSGFAGCKQIFAPSCGVRKVRYILDMIHYARHVFRHTNNNTTLIIDNYEITYVLAVYFCRLRGRSNPVVLEYEDGKHAIDHGWIKVITWLAEWLGRPLVDGAILATPTLSKRLQEDTPTVLVPGVLEHEIRFNPLPTNGGAIRFLYSGSLDVERGGPLLLDYLETCTLPQNAIFEITGQGSYQERLIQLMERYPGKVTYHGSVSNQALAEIRSRCHYGLNLQSSSNPISDVTYPSKTFDYLNSGLRVISTRAAGVETVIGEAARYLESETTGSLANAIESILTQDDEVNSSDLAAVQRDYSFEGTIRRLSATLGPIFNSTKNA